MPATFTTTLPDAQQPSLGNGVEDEISVDWTDVINYGLYDIQVRETGASTWNDWDSLDDTVQSDIITGREDGEEYEVRMRTRSEHVTGTWTASVDIVTLFPAATNLSPSSIAQTTVDLSWDDQSDNEDGFRVDRRRLYEAGWADWEQLADLAPNTVTYTDDTVHPGKEYEYRIESYTEHTSATSNTTTAETTDSGLDPQRVPSRGWYMEVQHPGGGVWHSPEVADDPKQLPVVNGLPKFDIPVAKNDKWRDGFDGGSARVWYNGERLPVDELDSIEQQTGKTVLRVVGGTELRDRVTKDVVEEDAHVVAEDLISTETTYTPNVDTPSTTADENVLQQEATTQSELEGLTSFGATDPFYFNADGDIEMYKTCFTQEAEDYASGSPGGTFLDDVFSDGVSIYFDASGQYAEWTFTLDYEIPAEEFEVAYRARAAGTNPPDMTMYLDGSELDAIFAIGNTGEHWAVYNANDSEWTDPGVLSPGTYTLRFEASSTGDAYRVDVVAPRDRRWDYNDDNDNGGSGGYLDGPEYHPSANVSFDASSTPASYSGGRIEVSMNDTTRGQALALSIDGGATWEEATNTTAHETDFTEKSATLHSRATMDGKGFRDTATPRYGYESQTLSEYYLYADVVDTPVLDNKGYDDTLVNVLRDIADYGNFVFEVRYNGSYSVEWTQLGQRPANQDIEDIVDYNVKTSTDENQVEKAVVFGSANPVTGETFTSNHDTEVSLGHSPIVEASERVHDGSGTTFEQGSDYILRTQAGTIEVLSTGSMSDATDYEIDYRYKISNSYTASGVSDPKTRRFDLQSIPTERGCGQAALYLVQELKDPVVEAEITLPKLPPTVNVINAINPKLLDIDEVMQIRNAQQSPLKATIVLENRESISDVVGNLQTRLSGVSRRV